MRENTDRRRKHVVRGGILLAAAIAAGAFVMSGSSGSHSAAPSHVTGAAKGQNAALDGNGDLTQQCAQIHDRIRGGLGVIDDAAITARQRDHLELGQQRISQSQTCQLVNARVASGPGLLGMDALLEVQCAEEELDAAPQTPSLCVGVKKLQDLGKKDFDPRVDAFCKPRLEHPDSSGTPDPSPSDFFSNSNG